jgi:predicted RNA-binding Zn-ribbon protein involved in translation (DUF1610 family)
MLANLCDGCETPILCSTGHTGMAFPCPKCGTPVSADKGRLSAEAWAKLMAAVTVKIERPTGVSLPTAILRHGISAVTLRRLP